MKYGFLAPLPDVSIALHARQLEFEHPVTKEAMCFRAPVPDMAHWEAAQTFYTV